MGKQLQEREFHQIYTVRIYVYIVHMAYVRSVYKNVSRITRSEDESRYLSWYRDGQQAERPGFESRHCKIFLFFTASRPTPGAHPASYPMGTGGSFSGGKTVGA
jgi:hypothetical protein